MPDIIHRIGIKAPEAEVFQALAALEGLANWWTREVRGESRPGGKIGTELAFGLSTQDGQSILMFAHRDWAESTESMAHCSMKWAVFLLSLREYVETGKGRPSPGDLKIDNRN